MNLLRRQKNLLGIISLGLIFVAHHACPNDANHDRVSDDSVCTARSAQQIDNTLFIYNVWEGAG